MSCLEDSLPGYPYVQDDRGKNNRTKERNYKDVCQKRYFKWLTVSGSPATDQPSGQNCFRPGSVLPSCLLSQYQPHSVPGLLNEDRFVSALPDLTSTRQHQLQGNKENFPQVSRVRILKLTLITLLQGYPTCDLWVTHSLEWP